jgi:DNA-binding transcriptional LysR family regulator
MKQGSNNFHYKKNRLHQIRGFCYAVAFLSMSKAAKELNLTQSTISLQIQSLERDLGFKLLNRSSKTFSLTKEGSDFYKFTCPLFYEFESVVEKFLENNQNKNQKIIDIAVHHIAISYVMPKVIAIFKKKHPNCKIILRNIPPNEAINRLRNDEINLAFYPSAENPPEIEYIKIKSYDPILIMNKHHSLAKKNIKNLKDLKGLDLIRIDRSLITLPLFEEVVKSHDLKGSLEFENGNWEMLKHLVEHNNFIAVVSEICLDKKDNLIVKNLSKFFPTMNYSLMHKKGHIFSKVEKDFIEIIKNI